MTDEVRGGDQIETEQQAKSVGLTAAEIWLKKIEHACAEEKDWRDEAKKAVDTYEADDDGATAFNIFHSNVETLLPALYNSTPVPDVRRRYGDADPIAKTVVDMTERCLSYLVDQYDFDETMQACVRDAIVPGRGVIRVRYEPEFMDQQGVEVKGYEMVTCEHVPYDRFARGPAKRWADVPWIAFKHDLTREELVKLAGKKGAEIDVKSSERQERDKDDSDTDKGIFRTACVWEIWDKPNRRVIFVAAEQKQVIKAEQDPLGLKEFFPIARPLQQIKRVSSLTPVTPYRVYRALIEELDVVTKRIRKLVAQLKVRGLVAADVAKDMEGVRSLEDGQYLSANEAASFISGGGKLENAIAHMPMDPTVKALQQLYIQRDAIKQTIYEVTGLSDILRGASDAQETATAQNIKSQWGSLRVQNLQREVQRVARDLFRLKTELMATHFEPQNLLQMSNFAEMPPDQLMPAIQMFKSSLRTFRIDIETDSTIRADMTRNQEQMNNFLAGTGQFVQGMMGAAQLMPALLPTMTEVYTAFARNFSLGKQAEDALDQLSQMAPQMAQAAEQAAGQNPEQQKMEMQMQFEQQKFELEKQKMGMDLQMKQADLSIKRAEMEMKQQGMQLDLEAKAADIQVRRQTADMDMQGRQMEMQFGQQKQEQELGHKQKLTEMELNKTKALQRVEFAKANGVKGVMIDDEGTVSDPYEQQMQALAQQIAQTVQQFRAESDQLQQSIQQLVAAVTDIDKRSKAPKKMQIVRGPDGKAVGARNADGSALRVVRGPDGKALGVETV